MAWIKIPKEHHEPFLACCPAGKGIKTIKMFGGIALMVNGNMAGGLWAKSVVVRLDKRNFNKAMKLKGSKPFDPMGKGHIMKDMVVLPQSEFKSLAKLTRWLKSAADFTASMPPKKKKAKPAKKPAPKGTAKTAAKKTKRKKVPG